MYYYDDIYLEGYCDALLESNRYKREMKKKGWTDDMVRQTMDENGWRPVEQPVSKNKNPKYSKDGEVGKLTQKKKTELIAAARKKRINNLENTNEKLRQRLGFERSDHNYTKQELEKANRQNKNLKTGIAVAGGTAAVAGLAVGAKTLIDKKHYKAWQEADPRKRSKVSYKQWVANGKPLKEEYYLESGYTDDYQDMIIIESLVDEGYSVSEILELF
jgi:hypothetical protein